MIARRCAISLSAGVLSVCTAFAEVGSVISSFKTSDGEHLGPRGVYRDASYVYCLFSHGSTPPYHYLRRYTTTGTRVSNIGLNYEIGFRDAGHCHLGSGHFAVVGDWSIYIMEKNSGYILQTLHNIRGPGGTTPRAVAWDGRYYYVAGLPCRGEFRRFTSTGSFGGTWFTTHWPASMTSTVAAAFAHRALGKSGDYLVATSEGTTSCVLDLRSGSCLGSWDVAAICGGSDYGDSSKAGTYGAAYWVNLSRGGGTETEQWVYEFDIGAAVNPAVVPASVGKIKAIYR